MNRPVVEPAQTDDRDDVVDARPARHRARFELIFAGIWLAIGLILLPALIFAVGSSLLGPYGESGRLGSFYGDFLRDLGEPSVRAWAIALGPLVLITILRLIFIGAGRGPGKSDDRDEEPAARPRRPATENHRRVEPSVSGE